MLPHFKGRTKELWERPCGPQSLAEVLSDPLWKILPPPAPVISIYYSFGDLSNIYSSDYHDGLHATAHLRWAWG